MNDFLTCSEFAKKYGVSRQNISDYCRKGWLKGAFKRGSIWHIPVDAEIPETWRHGLKGRWAGRKLNEREKADV